MSREQFAAATAGLGEAELRKALWTVYWRGTATVRERIEEILSPEPARAAASAAEPVLDPHELLVAVREFTRLVRSGAYTAGSRSVSPKERSQWRFTFRRLLAGARSALAAPDPAGGEAALVELIDLACEFRDYDYVRSEDPVEAAAIVVSDEVGVLWRHLLERHGFEEFAAQAAEQLLRWESRFGWTRSGWGKISQRECALADVLAGLLAVPDTWVPFTEQYLTALERLAAPPVPAAGRGRTATSTQRRREVDFRVSRRTETMTAWHLMLLERFAETPGDSLLDRVADNAAFGGPEQLYLQARLAQIRDDLPRARTLIHDALERLPGHADFLAFAQEIDAPLPPNARRVADSRRPPSSEPSAGS